MPIFINNTLYERVIYDKEEDFEKDVVKLADQVFGTKTIYIDVKKKFKGNNIGIIPDGYLLDLTISDEPKLFIIENEIVSHDPFKHIGIQLLKFATSFEDERISIRNFLMKEITNSKESLNRLNEGCNKSNSRNIDNYLDTAVYSDFKALILIDEARPELYKVLEKINSNISVIELKAFQSSSGEIAYHYDSLYEEEEISPQISSANNVSTSEDRQKRRLLRAQCDTIIVPAREDGFKRQFLGNNQWYAIRIGAAMKDRIKYIAAYQVAPKSSLTHYAEIKEIKPYQDSGKYIVIFKGDAKEIGELKLKDSNKSPQGPVYAKLEKILQAKYFDEVL